MLDRLRTDFRLSIITLLGASAVLGITPFAFFRFYTGDLLSGFIDSAILVGVVALVAYAWISGNTDRVGLFMALFLCGGATLVASMQADVRIFWLYPTLVSSFFLTAPAIAAIINTAAIVMLVSINTAFTSTQQMWSFIATSMVVSACAFAFARRTESQRLQLERLATFDPLTGVRNRRVMNEELDTAAATAMRTGVPYALVMLDLDHFKRINDSFGHSTGDRVLVEVAQMIEHNCRQVDHLFRFGGEEFVILLTGTGQEGAKSVVQGLQRKMAREVVGPAGPVTASFGIAVLRHGESAESWLARADAALYRAKEAGRNCFVSDDTPAPVAGALSQADSCN